MLSLLVTYECPCRDGFKYSTKETYRQHFKSKNHLLYSKTQNEKMIRKRMQELEIELSKSKREAEIWKQKYMELSLKYESIPLLEDFIS